MKNFNCSKISPFITQVLNRVTHSLTASLYSIYHKEYPSESKVVQKLFKELALSCESLMLDSESRSDTIPACTILNDDITFSHEASIGKISDETIFYLMSRGISEEEAKSLIVRGFAEPIAKAFPIEYAVEMNRLINMELEGTIG